MDKTFYDELESNEFREKWEREEMIIRLFEEGVEVEEIARIMGMSEEEMEERFPRLY